MSRPYKLPESVLVVIHTVDLQVLLLRRTDIGSWQSVTGSKDHLDEPFSTTAAREVAEETGLDVYAPGVVLQDWAVQNHYAIYPQYLHRYAQEVTHNTERVFGLLLPEPVPVRLSPREHTEFVWLPWQQAAQQVFSASNAVAIERLATRIVSDFGRC
jgi:dihydroneopterin triphosphate diphosphatase